MNKIKDIVLNKRVFVSFYALVILYNFLIIRLLSQDLFFFIRFTAFRWIYTGWSLLIVLYDLFHKRLFENKTKVLWGITFLTAVLSLVLQLRARTLLQIHELISFGILTYICVSIYCDCTSEQMNSFLKHLSRHAVILITIITWLSLVAAVYIYRGIALPKWMGIFHQPVMLTPSGHTISFLPRELGRYQGFFVSIPDAGFNCYLAILLNLFLLERKSINPVLSAISIITCGIIIILTDARDVMLICGIIIAVGLFCILSKHIGKKTAMWLTVIAVLLVLFGGGKYVYSYVVNRMEESGWPLFHVLNQLSSARIAYYRAGWNAFLERKIIGWGWLNCDALADYARLVESHPNYHNCVINLLAWTGIVGTASFFVALLYSAKKIFDNRKQIGETHSKWLVVLCVCVFLQSLLDICLFGEDMHIETVFFWVCLGYLVYLNEVNKRDLLNDD